MDDQIYTADPPGDPKDTIVIEGVTAEGLIFRPQNWPNRLCGLLSSFKRNRLIYSPYLRPCKRNGNAAVLMSPLLKKENFQVYLYILKFARRNSLTVYREPL